MDTHNYLNDELKEEDKTPANVDEKEAPSYFQIAFGDKDKKERGRGDSDEDDDEDLESSKKSKTFNTITEKPYEEDASTS